MGGLRARAADRVLDLPRRQRRAGRAAAGDRRLLLQGPHPVARLVVAAIGQGAVGSPASCGALFTAIYIFRLVFLVFFGERGRTPTAHLTWKVHLPLIVLALLSIVGGWVELPPLLGVNRASRGSSTASSPSTAAPPRRSTPRPMATPSTPSAAAHDQGDEILTMADRDRRLARRDRDRLAPVRAARPPAPIDRAARVPMVPAGLAGFWLRGWDFDRSTMLSSCGRSSPSRSSTRRRRRSPAAHDRRRCRAPATPSCAEARPGGCAGTPPASPPAPSSCSPWCSTMILLSLIVLHLVGGVAAWALGKHRVACRIACLVALGFELVLLAQLWGAAAAGDHAGALAQVGVVGSGRRRRRRAVVDRRRHLAVDSRVRHHRPSRGGRHEPAPAHAHGVPRHRRGGRVVDRDLATAPGSSTST